MEVRRIEGWFFIVFLILFVIAASMVILLDT